MLVRPSSRFSMQWDVWNIETITDENREKWSEMVMNKYSQGVWNSFVCRQSSVIASLTDWLGIPLHGMQAKVMWLENSTAKLSTLISIGSRVRQNNLGSSLLGPCTQWAFWFWLRVSRRWFIQALHLMRMWPGWWIFQKCIRRLDRIDCRHCCSKILAKFFILSKTTSRVIIDNGVFFCHLFESIFVLFTLVLVDIHTTSLIELL